MVIKVDQEAKDLLLNMADVVVKAQGIKAAEFGTRFPKLIELIESPKLKTLNDSKEAEMKIIKNSEEDIKKK